MLLKVVAAYRRAYAGLPRRAWILSLVELVNHSGTMVVFFMTLYLTRELGYSIIQAGQAMSAFGVGSLAGAYLGGWLCDRFGATRIQLLCLGLAGVCYILLGQVAAFAPIIGLLFLGGAAVSALHPANGTAMSQACSAEMRVKGFALNRLAINLGITIGPVAGGYLALLDYRLLFWVDGLTSLAAAVVLGVLLGRSGAPPAAEPGPEPPPLRSPWRDRPFLALAACTFGVGLIFSQLMCTFPLYLNAHYRLPEHRIGLVIAVNTVLIVIFEMLLLNWLRHFHPVRMIAAGALFFGAGFALLPLGRSFAFAALTVAVWTVGEMISMPLTGSVVASRAQAANVGRYMGVFSLSFTVASIVGPALGTAVYDRHGGDWLWAGVGALAVALWLAYSRVARHFPAAPAPAGQGK